MNAGTQKKIDTLNETIFRDMYKDISRAEEMAGEALALSGEAGYTDGTAWALLNTGLINVERGRFGEALLNLRQANLLFLETGSLKGTAASLNSLGLCCIRMGKMKEAFHNLREALNLNRENEFKSLEYTSLNYLGILQFKSENYSRALRFFEKARKLASKDSLTSILNNLGCTYRAQGEYGQALLHLNNALLHAEKEGRSESQVAILEEIALVFGEMGSYEKGISTLRRALEKCRDSGSRYRLSISIHMGEQFIQMGDFDSAEKTLISTLELVDEANAVESRKVFRHLSAVYENKGDYKASLEHFRRYHDLSSSVKSSDLEEQIWQLETEQLETLNRRISAVGEMGKKMTVCLNREGIYRILYSSLAELFKTDFCIIGEIDSEGEVLTGGMMEYREEQASESRIDINLRFEPRNALEWTVRHQSCLLISDYKREIGDFLTDADGSLYPVEPSSILCLPFQTGSVRGVIGVFSTEKYAFTPEDREFLELLASYAAIALSNSDHTEKILDYNSRLIKLNKYDALTGIYNRREVVQNLTQSWNISRRKGTWLHVMILDVDHFKLINDSFGHDAGDVCLKEMGSVFRDLLQRTQDGYGRYGGEEFLVFMQDMPPREAVEMAEKIRERVAALPVSHQDQAISMTVSIGLHSIIPPREDKSMDVFAMIRAADTNMYTSKSQGRNRVTATLV